MMFAVLRLLKTVDLKDGGRITVESEEQQCVGMMPVFATQEAAEEVFGPDIDCLHIEVNG